VKAALFIILMLVISAAGLLATAVISESEARQQFESSGCTGCHNGGLAPDFDGVVAEIQAWASEYDNLDAAVAAEAPSWPMFNTIQGWDELVSSMPGMTTDLADYFANVFDQAKGGGQTTTTTTPPTGTATTTQTTTTQATTTTTTTTTTATTESPSASPLPSVTTLNPSEAAGPLIKRSLLIGLGLFVIAIGALMYALRVFRSVQA